MPALVKSPPSLFSNGVNKVRISFVRHCGNGERISFKREINFMQFEVVSKANWGPATRIRFSLKTRSFRCAFVYHSHYNDRKRGSFSSKTHTLENAVQYPVLWTAKTEAFENADVIHTTNVACGRVYLSHAQMTAFSIAFEQGAKVFSRPAFECIRAF